MKILVTGANGYLGQGVVKALLDNGHSVVAADFKTNYVDPPPSIILHESGAFVTQTALGFDGEATRKMSAFLQGQKPELLHHQKFFENGTAERAKESGTEQNYNMIDGCVNNVPQKPRRIGGRWSVLDRLHIKQAERRQKDNTPQQEQERSRKS